MIHLSICISEDEVVEMHKVGMEYAPAGTMNISETKSTL
jgi:hypothetical protein